MDVVWSCISITILSTWSVLHLNVPPHRPKADTAVEKIRRQITLLYRKLGWMTIMLIFPEYPIVHSATKLAVAWGNTKQLQKMADCDGVPWSLQHTLLADMGGIAIRFDQCKKSPDESSKEKPPETSMLVARSTSSSSSHERQDRDHDEAQRANADELDQAGTPQAAVRMKQLAFGPKVLEAQEFSNLHDVEIPGIGLIAASAINTCRLDSSYVALAKRHNIIKTLPHIEEEEIADKNKADGLVKLLAILQVIWLIAQLITRKCLGLPTTSLEVNTVAIAASAFCLYIIEWMKPKDVGVPFYIEANRGTSYESFSEKIRKDRPKSASLEARRYYISDKKTTKCCPGVSKADPRTVQLLVSIISIPLFGGVHLFAWNYTFPTPFEQFLWRICATITVAAPFGIAAMSFLLFKVLDGSKGLGILFGLLAPFTILVYPAARVFLIIESFRSLYYLPPDHFRATWAASAPHLG